MTQKQQTENHGELSGKRIVVLGGSSGIGLAVAQQAVAQGATASKASGWQIAPAKRDCVPRLDY